MMMNENGIQNFDKVLTSMAFTSYFLQAAQTRPVVATQLAGSQCPSPLWERRNTTWASFSRYKIYPKCPKGVNVNILQANWYKAEQYCRFHGMHLASIDSADEQRDLQEHIQAVGMGHEHFWTSGTDQGEEGKFFWMSTGRPITYSNYNAGEPNNFE